MGEGQQAMKKTLSEMSLEELWQLFPIFLTEHQEQWDTWYEEEAKALYKALPEKCVIRISHIGSTAIKNIWSKPIIDILVEVSRTCNMARMKETLLQEGYCCMSESEQRISFNKGYTKHGFSKKVYHLHLRYDGDHDELYFRDYLNKNPLLAKQYEALKLSLWKEYEHDRDQYTENKTDFVTECTKKAKLEMI